MKKNISVIIPVYNVEKYIVECLESLLKQTQPFDEIIIIDDGSTDMSKKICQQYAMKYTNIIYYSQSNMGAAKARNKGLELAGGDYIFFIDADDMVPEICSEELHNIIQSIEGDVIYFSSEIIGDKQSGVRISQDAYYRPNELCNIVMTGVEALEKSFPNNYIMSACFEVVRRSYLLANNICFLEDNVYEDRIYSLMLIAEAKIVMFTQTPLYIRRFRENSISTSIASKRKMKDALLSHEREWKYLKESVLWKTNREFVLKYVMSSVQMYLSKYTNTHRNPELDKQYAYMFEREWGAEINYSCMEIDDLCSLLHLINVAENRCRISMQFSKTEVKNMLDVKTKNWLIGLLGNCSNIMVYGVGEHTKCLEMLLQRYGINLKNISYVVTENTYNNSLFSISEINEKIIMRTDKFILSSKRYQNEMQKNLKLCGVPKEKICKFYSFNNESDLVMIFDTLKEADGK